MLALIWAASGIDRVSPRIIDVLRNGGGEPPSITQARRNRRRRAPPKPISTASLRKSKGAPIWRISLD